MVKRKEQKDKRKSEAKKSSDIDYEMVRKKNIARNQSILQSLNIDAEPVTHSKAAKYIKKVSTKERHATVKTAESRDDVAPRRSRRERKEIVTYNEDQISMEAEKPKPGSYIQPYSPAGMKVIQYCVANREF